MVLRLFFAVLAVIAAAIGALALIIAVFGWDWLRGPLEARVSAAIDRQVEIGAPLEVEWRWSFKPIVWLEDVRVSDLDWTGNEHFATVERAAAEISLADLFLGRLRMPRAGTEGLVLRLTADGEGGDNWTLGEADGGAGPIVESLHLEDARVIYVNTGREIAFDARLQSRRVDDETLDRVDIQGEGRLRDQPITFRGEGDGVVTLREGEDPFGFELAIEGGDSRFTFDGSLGPRASFSQLAGRVTLEGPSLGELSDFTGIPAPDTSAYALSLRLTRIDDLWRARDIEGEVGQSDLAGRLDYKTGGDRPYVNAALHSRELDVRDVGLLVGAGAQDDSGTAETEPRRLFPDARLDIERISGVDGDLRFSGQAVEGVGASLGRLQAVVRLREQVLSFEPVEFDYQGGRLGADIVLDARETPYTTTADASFAGVQLSDFFDTDRVSGRFSGRAELTGQGDSVRRALAVSDGRVVAVLDEGTISRRTVELIGLDLLSVLFADDEPVAASCGVAELNVTGGIAATRAVLATPRSMIEAQGEIDLGSERLDLEVQARDTSPNVGSLGGPVMVSGALTDPQIRPGGETVLRGLASAALGVIFAPAAAILGTVQLDVAEGGVCERLLEGESPEAD